MPAHYHRTGAQGEGVPTRGVSGTRGLGQMTAPEGVFVLYSAGVGQTALDRLSDDDPNPSSVLLVRWCGSSGSRG